MKLEVPAAVGVPEICPVEVFNVSPAGSVPTEILHVTGAVPPLDATVAVYARFTSAAAKEVVVTESTGALMVRLNDFVAVSGGLPESVTLNVRFAVPAVVGVPEIAPVDALSDKPAGKVPALSAQVYGPTPPLS